MGGAPAQGVDFLNVVYGAFPWILLLALLLAYLVLARAFRSLVLPLIATLLSLVSVGSAYGLLVVVFRFGVGSAVLGTYHVSQIEGWVPVFLFAMLFGLSMDYEVFIVARIREAWLNGANTSDAIVEGLSNTGAVVTSAALIMVAALSGLVFGHIAGLQELGLGLALGVLVDATIVRGFLLPSVMALCGRNASGGCRRIMRARWPDQAVLNGCHQIRATGSRAPGLRCTRFLTDLARGSPRASSGVTRRARAIP